MSCCRSPERGDQHSALSCSSWGSCRQKSPLILLFLQLNKSSDLSCSSSVLSSRPFTILVGLFWTYSTTAHSKPVWCPPYIKAPKPAQFLRWGCTRTECGEKITSLNWLPTLRLMCSRAPSALWAARTHSYSTCHQPRCQDLFLWGYCPAFCTPVCTCNQDYPVPAGECSTCSC